MSKMLTPRQKERRARILRTARELINEAGYAGMTTRELAARANVSATTLFNLYNTKEELLLAALREQLDGMNAELAEAAAQPGVEQILGIHEIIASQAERTPAYAKAIVHACVQAGPGEPLVRLLVGNFQAIILHSLESMSEKNQLKNGVELESLAKMLVSCFWGIQLLWDKGIVADSKVRSMSLRGSASILASWCKGKSRRVLEERLQDLPV